MAEKPNQIVYVLTNPAMPGLVKIGKTTQADVKERMKQLYGTGVPVPFDCFFACKVKDAGEVEKALHFAFGMAQINPNREFFRLEPERVVEILKLLKIDDNDITQQVEKIIESDIPSVDKQSAETMKKEQSAETMKKRRPPMNFHEIGIPNGSILVSKKGNIQCTVVDEKKVEYNGEICSLAAATRMTKDYPLPLLPSRYWTFNGKTVRWIYKNYHGTAGES